MRDAEVCIVLDTVAVCAIEVRLRVDEVRIVDRGAALRAGAVEHVHIAVVGGGVIQRRSLRLRACGHRALALVPVERELELICVMRRQARHSLAEDAETSRPGTAQTRQHSVGATIMLMGRPSSHCPAFAPRFLFGLARSLSRRTGPNSCTSSGSLQGSRGSHVSPLLIRWRVNNMCEGLNAPGLQVLSLVKLTVS